MRRHGCYGVFGYDREMIEEGGGIDVRGQHSRNYNWLLRKAYQPCVGGGC